MCAEVRGSMSMKKFDIFGLDFPCMDLNVNIDGMPEANHGARIQEMSWQGGGKVSSGMVAAARLGAKCAMAAALGDDIYGRFCYQDFIKHGINVDQVLLRRGETSHLSVVLSDRKTQTRTILFRAGSVKPLEGEELDLSPVADSEYLFLADTRPLSREAARAARAAGTGVFIDADYYTEELREMIPLIDVFVGSEFVFDGLFPGKKEGGDRALEEACREILKRGPKICVFTFGEKGCAGLGEEGFFSLPAFEVEVKDTVGAGDVFHGAFLAALLKGKSLRECAGYASAVSAIKCTRIGGRAGIPNEAVLERFLQTGEIDYEEIDQRVEYYRRGLEHV